MRPKNTLYQLRMALGFSQQDLADYLGLSRSMVALCENGHRSLPTAALLRLNDLVLLLDNGKPRRLPQAILPKARLRQLEAQIDRLQIDYAL
ncbi:MAG: hypothetical protein OHK0053_27620 [Microscillaceae bacterium]